MNFETLETIVIDHFPLKWRWTDAKYLLMPEGDLAKIQPLSKNSSLFVYNESLRLIEVTNIENAGERQVTSGSESDVTMYLQSTMPDTTILVSWDSDSAVITETGIFQKYWDEFCYPSSDDVSIWGGDKSWLLQYFHYEEFSFVSL
jgi:hypothetical protein